MSRKEFAVWLACLLLITLGAAILCVWMLPGCASPARVAESIKVEAGHGEGELDWANSQRSARSEQNWVAVGFNPFAGVAAEPRDPVWGDLHYPREVPDAPDVTVTVPVTAPDPAPSESDQTTLIVSSISAVIVAAIGVWQRQHVVAGVKKLVGRKTEEGE